MKLKLLSIVLLVIILSGCNGNPLLNSNSDDVLEVAEQIVDFPLPVGFKPELTANFKGYNFISYQPDQENSHLYIVQSTKPEDGENLQDIIDSLVPGASDKNSDQEVIANLPITIRGQDSTMVHSKGTNSDGEEYQQVLIAFEGKRGPALFVYSALSKDWDMESILSIIETNQ